MKLRPPGSGWTQNSPAVEVLHPFRFSSVRFRNQLLFVIFHVPDGKFDSFFPSINVISVGFSLILFSASSFCDHLTFLLLITANLIRTLSFSVSSSATFQRKIWRLKWKLPSNLQIQSSSDLWFVYQTYKENVEIFTDFVWNFKHLCCMLIVVFVAAFFIYFRIFFHFFFEVASFCISRWASVCSFEHYSGWLRDSAAFSFTHMKYFHSLVWNHWNEPKWSVFSADEQINQYFLNPKNLNINSRLLFLKFESDSFSVHSLSWLVTPPPPEGKDLSQRRLPPPPPPRMHRKSPPSTAVTMATWRGNPSSLAAAQPLLWWTFLLTRVVERLTAWCDGRWASEYQAAALTSL